MLSVCPLVFTERGVKDVGAKYRDSSISMRFSDRLAKALVSSGWSSGRRNDAVLSSYRNQLGSCFHAVAASIILEFGGLGVGSRVFFDVYYAELDLRYYPQVTAAIGLEVCPIALTTYHIDAVVWVASTGEVFLVEPGDVFYVAPTFDESLEILICDGNFLSAPQSLHPGRWKIRSLEE